MTTIQDQQQQDDDDDLEWEEWNATSTTFTQHCLAGSLAGVAEHVLVYPLDTVKTHIQCAACFQSPPSKSVGAAAAAQQVPQYPPSTWATLKSLVRADATASLTQQAAANRTAATTTSLLKNFDPTRLWRGVQAILVGCIPAHALYFSSYEAVKYAFTDPISGQVSGTGAMLAGAAAVFGHDVIITPLDTMKQRLQLGHYRGMVQCAQHIFGKEGGMWGFYRSFPVTLLTNVPYGMIMVRVNEWGKQELKKQYGGNLSVTTTSLLASSLAGAVAAGGTTPLDRIKTVLQTQQLQPASCPGTCPKWPTTRPSGTAGSLEWKAAILKIYESEGAAGFFRGVWPRILSHTPAVAISWTTYETAKHALLKYNIGN